MSDPDLWRAVLYVHVLAMAFFLGGQLFIALAVVPIERASPDPVRLRLVARRFGIGSLVALGVLLASGAAMASHYGLWGSDTLRVKLGLVATVMLLTAVHLRYPRARVLQVVILLATLAIVWLGLDLAS